MKILILGSYYSDNLGDGVICECVKYQIQNRFPTADCVCFDLWDRTCFQTRGVKDMASTWKRELRTWLRARVTRLGIVDKQYKHEQNMINCEREYFERLSEQDCDLVVFAGGQMFMDTYALKISWLVRRFEERGIPVIFNACGVGPNYSRQIRKYLSEALESSCVRGVSCRDDVETVNRLYTAQSRRSVPVADSALWCSQCYGAGKDSSSAVVGLGIMSPYRNPITSSCRFWVRMIRELERREIKWKIFVNGSGSDDTFARHVIASIPELSGPFEDYSVPIPTTPEELIGTISKFKSIISFRLHSHIIAASLGIPSVAVVWDGKVRFFFEKIGHPERCCTLRDKPSKVLDKLATAEREGYDRKMIDEQKRYSEEWLMKAIEKTGLT